MKHTNIFIIKHHNFYEQFFYSIDLLQTDLAIYININLIHYFIDLVRVLQLQTKSMFYI